MSIYVLDTDHLSLHLRGHLPLKNKLLNITSENIFITIITVEEFFRGRLAQIRRAQNPEDRIKSYYWFSKSYDYLQRFQILNYDLSAEAHFQNLKDRKIRVGTQDLKIASIALSKKAILVTRNHEDFKKIPLLNIEDWSINDVADLSGF